jgi:hypothetical protein
MLGVLLVPVRPITMMPLWIIDNEPTQPFIRCYLGSEPTAEAHIEELPRSCLVSRPTTVPADAYAGLVVPEHLNGYVFGIACVDLSLVPKEIMDRIAKGVASGKATMLSR